MPGGVLQTMILVIQDRFTRKVWAKTLPGKESAEVVTGFEDVLGQITRSTTADTRKTGRADTGVRQVVTDMGMQTDALAKFFMERNIIHRPKNTSNRQELQNNSILDSMINKIQGTIQERRLKAGKDGKLDPAWVPHVAPTIAEMNKDPISGFGMMGSNPTQATQSKVVQFNMLEALSLIHI